MNRRYVSVLLALLLIVASNAYAQRVSLSGIYGVSSGGTGVGTFTANGVLYGNTTGAVLVTAQGPTNSVLIANAGAPSFSATPTVTSLTTTGALTVGAGLTVSGVGPHAVGGAVNAQTQVVQRGSFAPADAAVTFYGYELIPSITVPAGRSAVGLYVAPTLIEAASGVHAVLAGIDVLPAITPGVGTATDFFGIRVQSTAVASGTTTATGLSVAAPTGATSNYAATFTGGRVGIGTTGPVVQLEVINSDATESRIELGNVGGYTGKKIFLALRPTDNYGKLDVYNYGSSTGMNLALNKDGGNVGIATMMFGTSAVGVLALGASTAPSTSPADVVQLYECDVVGAGTGGLCIRDEGGTILKAGNGVFHVGANPGLTNTVTVCSSGACVTTCTLTFTGGILTTKGANCG